MRAGSAARAAAAGAARSAPVAAAAPLRSAPREIGRVAGGESDALLSLYGLMSLSGLS